MINSHYVPQFILRNFYADDKITYCDLEKKTVQPRNTRSVFSEEGYYPENIEKDLCKKAEYQFANLYHNKLEEVRSNLTLTVNELFTIKKYLIVSAIRYKYELSEEDIKLTELLGPAYKIDYDRNLNEILACDTPEDIFNVLGKAEEFLRKTFQEKDTGNMEDVNIPLWAELKDILHSYLIFVKIRGDEKFLVPDIGRGTYFGPLGIKKTTALFENVIYSGNQQLLQLMQMVTPRDYSIYPLSKNLAILSMNSFYKIFTESEFHVNVKFPEDYPTVSAVLGFGDSSAITPPRVRMNGCTKEYKYDIKSLTNKDVCHFNSIMIGEAIRYVACAELKDIQKSVQTAIDYTDRDLLFLKI